MKLMPIVVMATVTLVTWVLMTRTSIGRQIYAMGGLGITNTSDVAAPPCVQQGPQKPIGGPPNQSTDYLHVNPLP